MALPRPAPAPAAAPRGAAPVDAVSQLEQFRSMRQRLQGAPAEPPARAHAPSLDPSAFRAAPEPTVDASSRRHLDNLRAARMQVESAAFGRQPAFAKA